MEYTTKHGDIVLFDSADAALVTDVNWFIDENGYVRGNKLGRMLRMHRVILAAPRGQRVDHVDGKRWDNRRKNLRFCTAKQNSQNKKPWLDRKYKGVFRYRGDSRYRVIVDGVHMGYFDCEEAAANCYNHHAKVRHGEFARLNVVTVKMAESEWAKHRKQKQSPFRGVRRLPGGTFRAGIQVDDKFYHLGCFETSEAAACAYDAYITNSGLKRKTNFPAKARAAGLLNEDEPLS